MRLYKGPSLVVWGGGGVHIPVNFQCGCFIRSWFPLASYSPYARIFQREAATAL